MVVEEEQGKSSWEAVRSTAMAAAWRSIAIFVCVALQCSTISSQQETTRFDYPRANLSTSWVNRHGDRGSVDYANNITVRAMLLHGPAAYIGAAYACAFHRSSGANGYSFSVIMVYLNSGGLITMPTRDPIVVWSANRNRLVGENATLDLTKQGDLALSDEQRNTIWSSNTSGMGVMAMEVLGSGNLVLLDAKQKIVWQSFDSPTDTLLPGQVLRAGMRLTSSTSAQDQAQEGDYFLEMESDGLVAYVGRTSPQTYWSMESASKNSDVVALLTNGSIHFTVANVGGNSSESVSVGTSITVTNTSSQEPDYRFLKLNWNGSIVIYTPVDLEVKEARSLMARAWQCELPRGCGPYGLCTIAGTCSCSYAGASALVPLDDRASEKGCVPVTPFSTCNNSTSTSETEHYLAQVDRADYFNLKFLQGVKMASIGDCGQLCLKNCSCKTAFYVVDTCYVLDEVYSLREPWKYDHVPEIPSSALIKLQRPPQASTARRNQSKRSITIGLAIGMPVLATTFVLVASYRIYRSRRRRALRRRKEELMLDTVPGAPRRFLYEELCVATQDFSNKLGEGGFGSVFSGTLLDGSKVAVKRLGIASRQGHKEFRAEVTTIGSIHHFHLVQLRGFCAEGDLRLLVYEHVPNGSLDKWLFTRKEDAGNASFVLGWESRFQIALGTARGLAYLHEGCRERIIHMDVKPQNILLDATFNAKLCDFGMSKLMTRENTHVFTTMRGTRGYMAPEWLQASITEKVDVYSYGVVLLELMSGQRCLDMAREESSKRYLAAWVSSTQGFIKLAELADEGVCKEAGESECVRVQVETVLQIAVSCIRDDPERRLSMRDVVQMLEGVQAPPRDQVVETESDNE